MELLFLGTGAANWQESDRVLPGFRRKSSVLADGELLIDAGPDIFRSAEELLPDRGLDGVKNILQTHAHGDHLSRESLVRLCALRARRIWGDGGVLCAAGEIENLEKIPLEPYRAAEIGGFGVTPVEANHPANPGERPYHYIVEKEGKRLFYGCDGAWLLYPAWRAISGLSFDLIVLDGTVGEARGDYRNFEHNSLPMVRLLAETFRERGVLKPGGTVMISHLAKDLHDEKNISKLPEEGIFPACDGMRIKL